MEFLSEEEWEFVMGFIFNKFWGDVFFLKFGFEFFEKCCGKFVFGVVLYIEYCLFEEDLFVEFLKVRGDFYI